MKDWFKDMDKWVEDFHCNECGNTEYESFRYDRTVANGEVWICAFCNNEVLVDEQPNQDDY